MTISLRGVVYFVLLAALGVGIGVAAGRLQDVPAAGEPVELVWEQLIPQSSWFGGQSGRVISGMIQHGQISPLPDLTQDQSALVSDYDGKRVRIPGYIVPIGFDGVGVKEFLLVPYVGACIHVPPPPPNQTASIGSRSASGGGWRRRWRGRRSGMITSQHRPGLPRCASRGGTRSTFMAR